jgi:hypothetical protein
MNHQILRLNTFQVTIAFKAKSEPYKHGNISLTIILIFLAHIKDVERHLPNTPLYKSTFAYTPERNLTNANMKVVTRLLLK